jgi:hypothetical protein
MDETAVAVRGGRHYLYRAVDRHGKSVASLLCKDRSMEAAQEFFRAAVSQDRVLWPEKINVDGNSATHRGLRLLADEDHRWRGVEVRARRYLNNVVEQDHRAIKQRCAPMLGLKSFQSAAITLAGIELAHRIHKQQYSVPMGEGRNGHSLRDAWVAALRSCDVSRCGANHRISPMHQNSRARAVGRREPPRVDGQVRYPRKIFFGGGLYLLLHPQGGRYWHYQYRYGGKRKTLSLGTHPDVPPALAQARHHAARQMLAAGADPSLRRSELRQMDGGGPLGTVDMPGKGRQAA